MLDHDFKFKPSMQFLILIGMVTSASLAIIFYLPIQAGIQLLCSLFVILYGGYIFWRYGLLCSKHSAIIIRHRHDGKWLITDLRGLHEAELLGESTITPWVSVLRFRLPKQVLKKTCIVFRDSLGEDQYRQLLVRVRMF